MHTSIPDPMSGTILGAGYFCMPTNILELCSGSEIPFVPVGSCSEALLAEPRQHLL